MIASNPPLRRVDAGELSVGYYDLGSPADEPVVLLHGFPYDVHSYTDVVPLLVESGFRVLVPYLRGHGPTRFLKEDGVLILPGLGSGDHWGNYMRMTLLQPIDVLHTDAPRHRALRC